MGSLLYSAKLDGGFSSANQNPHNVTLCQPEANISRYVMLLLSLSPSHAGCGEPTLDIRWSWDRHGFDVASCLRWLMMMIFGMGFWLGVEPGILSKLPYRSGSREWHSATPLRGYRIEALKNISPCLGYHGRVAMPITLIRHQKSASQFLVYL